MRILVLALLACLSLSSTLAGQEEQTAQEQILRDAESLALKAFRFDRDRVFIRGSARFEGNVEMVQTDGQGTCAWLKGLEFSDGVIECDMAGGSYLGISFRVIEDPDSSGRISEDIYFRVEGNERARTVQYYPHGKRKQEELHRPPDEMPIRLIKQKEWFHVRVEVNGREARVFLDRNPEPVMVIEQLMHEHDSGSVGLRSWGGTFANLEVIRKP